MLFVCRCLSSNDFHLDACSMFKYFCIDFCQNFHINSLFVVCVRMSELIRIKMKPNNIVWLVIYDSMIEFERPHTKHTRCPSRLLNGESRKTKKKIIKK